MEYYSPLCRHLSGIGKGPSTRNTRGELAGGQDDPMGSARESSSLVEVWRVRRRKKWGEPYDSITYLGGLTVIYGFKDIPRVYSLDPVILGGLAAASEISRGQKLPRLHH